MKRKKVYRTYTQSTHRAGWRHFPFISMYACVYVVYWGACVQVYGCMRSRVRMWKAEQFWGVFFLPCSQLYHLDRPSLARSWSHHHPNQAGCTVSELSRSNWLLPKLLPAPVLGLQHGQLLTQMLELTKQTLLHSPSPQRLLSKTSFLGAGD